MSTLRIYDTATRSQRDFEPIRPGHASIYLCGATPQAQPHIGHLRSGVAFDILRRWLLAQGYDVALVRNVTDIDDKILTKAAENNRPWWEWVSTYEREFTKAYNTLGVLPPSVEPRATGFVTQMVDYMQRLIDAGFAYPAEGSVYFDVAAWTKAEGSDYGSLSGNKVEEMEQGEGEDSAKRGAQDFALWKAAKPGEPSWPTPWGDGRPGWHLECSAMSTYYLGSNFDIHCGGLDLQFPHHENEIAQSHAAGDKFANYWMHNHWVTMSGEKMSKSLGNVLSIPNMLELVRPVELRYYLGSAHYRSVLEYSEAALTEAAAGYRRIEDFLAHFDDLELGEWTPAIRPLPPAMRPGRARWPARYGRWHTYLALTRWSGKMERKLAGRMPRWMRWCRLNWSGAPRRVRTRTSLLPTPSVTASRPPASPSPIPQTARPGRWRSVKHSERTINYGTYPRPRWRGNPQDQ